MIDETCFQNFLLTCLNLFESSWKFSIKKSKGPILYNSKFPPKAVNVWPYATEPNSNVKTW